MDSRQPCILNIHEPKQSELHKLHYNSRKQNIALVKKRFQPKNEHFSIYLNHNNFYKGLKENYEYYADKTINLI